MNVVIYGIDKVCVGLFGFLVGGYLVGLIVICFVEFFYELVDKIDIFLVWFDWVVLIYFVILLELFFIKILMYC